MENHTEYIIISTTVNNEDDAHQMAEKLVQQRLAACVQILPIKSVYRWKDIIESDAEYLLLAKTTRLRSTELQDVIRAQHTYELPEIVETPICGGLNDYLEWIATETRSRSHDIEGKGN